MKLSARRPVAPSLSNRDRYVSGLPEPGSFRDRFESAVVGVMTGVPVGGMVGGAAALTELGLRSAWLVVSPDTYSASLPFVFGIKAPAVAAALLGAAGAVWNFAQPLGEMER